MVLFGFQTGSHYVCSSLVWNLICRTGFNSHRSSGLCLPSAKFTGICSSVAAVADTNIYPIWKHSAPRTRWLEALELVRFLSSSAQHCPAIPNTRGLSCQRQGATVLWTQDLIVFRSCYLLFSHSVTSCQMLPQLSGRVL